MSTQNKEILYQWFREGWNEGREAAIDDIMHPEVIAHGLGTEPVVGIEAFRGFYKAFNQILSDIHITVDKNLADGDYVTAICTLTGTYTATGAPVNITGSSTARIADGKIVEAWNNFDFLTFNLQIGKITPEQLA